MTSQVSDKELNRQFRCLGQTISMHSMLRDRYERWAVFVNLLLLASSVVFCATSFAHSYISQRFGVPEQIVADVLGVAAIAAFFAVLATMVLDWKGRAARHDEAAKILTTALAVFRGARGGDGWAGCERQVLSQAYWDAMKGVAPIPDRCFTKLKIKHLRKVAVSKMSDILPGCPLFLIRFLVFYRSISHLRNRPARIQDEKDVDVDSEPDSPDGTVPRSEGDRDSSGICGGD